MTTPINPTHPKVFGGKRLVMSVLGDSRRAIRERAGVSQAAVARMARVTAGAVAAWERTGLVKSKSRIARERLEEVYAWLAAGPDAPPRIVVAR